MPFPTCKIIWILTITLCVNKYQHTIIKAVSSLSKKDLSKLQIVTPTKTISVFQLRWNPWFLRNKISHTETIIYTPKDCYLPWDNNTDCSVRCGEPCGEQRSGARGGCGQRCSTAPRVEAASLEARGVLWKNQDREQLLDKHRCNLNIIFLAVLCGRQQFILKDQIQQQPKTNKWNNPNTKSSAGSLGIVPLPYDVLRNFQTLEYKTLYFSSNLNC